MQTEPGRLGGWSEIRWSRRALDFAVPLLAYGGLSLLFFNASAADWRHDYFGVGSDPIILVWSLHWWPFAILHHLNPFLSYYVWHPLGLNMTWIVSMPSAALIGAPITLLGGSVLTFNVLSLLAPALSAWTAYLLTRTLSNHRGAAFVGGYLFGFSSYELGHLLAHLHLTLVFLVPLAALLCVLRVRHQIGRWRFVLLLQFILLAQLGISTEIFATLCLMGALTWLIFLLCAQTSDRTKFWRLAAEIVLGALGASVLAAPFLFYVVKGWPDVPPIIQPATTYSADLLNFFIPTAISRFGRTVFEPLASRFTGDDSGHGAYLGIPLLFLVGLYFRDNFGDRYTRALLLTLCIFVLLSLGPWLHVGGVQTGLPMPWWIAANLPLIKSALPQRFAMYVALLSSVVTSLYISSGIGRWRFARYTLAILACIFLLPNVSRYHWTRWPEQPFFSRKNVRQALGFMPNVLVLPSGSGYGLAWQLNADMAFTQAAADLGVLPYREHAWPVLGELSSGAVDSRFENDFSAFCATHAVNYVIFGPAAPVSLLAAVGNLHWSQSNNQGVIAVAVPPSSQLSYNYILGDYWPSPARFNWMGQRVVVVTRNEPAVLTLSGLLRPSAEIVEVTVADQTHTSVYPIGQSDIRMISLPPSATVTLTAGSTFVPDNMIHNGDKRQLSVAVSLQPRL